MRRFRDRETMKQKMIVGLALAFALVLTGCNSNVQPDSSGNPPAQTSAVQPAPAVGGAEQYKDGTLTYSNLVGEEVQTQVRDVMLVNGISEADANKFFVWVNDFNEIMKDCESYELQDEFITVDVPMVDYGDYGPMSRMWYKTNGREYSDVLCRIAAFHLMKQNISVSEFIDEQDWARGEDQWLCSDWEAISGFSLVDFSEEETARYFTLYDPVSVEEDRSAEELYEAIIAEWARRGVTFGESSVSLITIWTQYGEQTAAAHAAVLIDNGGELWLIEKTNPQSPYQASRFSSVEQVGQYMYEALHIDDVRYGMETGTYVVLQNDSRLR